MNTTMTMEEIRQEIRSLSENADLKTFAELIMNETGGNRDKVLQILSAVKRQIITFRSSQRMDMVINTYMGEA